MTAASLNPARCKAMIADRQIWSLRYQCHRAPVRDGFCKQHHPDAEAARRAKSHARWEERYAEDQRRRALAGFGAHASSLYAALKAIADGHNDPRTVAREAIEGIDPP